MIYKFNDKGKKKAIRMIISIVPILAILLVFFYAEWTTVVIAFSISAFDFYYTRKINRCNKIRIKELSIIDNKIKFSFFYKRKVALNLEVVDYDIAMNERQIIFSNNGKSIIWGIANKEDMEEPEKWNNLISELTTNTNC